MLLAQDLTRVLRVFHEHIFSTNDRDLNEVIV